MACVLIYLACLLSVGLLPCSTTAATTEDSVYYVRPTDFQDASENCSIASEGQPCRTLNDYATDTTEDLFTLVSNARFLFLPGTHQLNVRVTILLATNVTFTAYDEGHVVLSSTSSGEITCILCVNVELSGLTFIVNTSSQSGQAFDAVMLCLSDSSASVLSNLTFIGNGHAPTSALALMSSNVTISNIQISSFVSSGGGAISANRGFIDFRGYNSFVNNTASSSIGGGGAIYLDRCTTKFYSTTVFTNNTSTRARGGALLSRNSDTTFYGNVTFTSNRAMSGGALSIGGGSTNFYGFVNNASSEYGEVDTCTQDGDYFEPDSGTATFLNNSAQREGGAIDIGTGNLSIISGDMSFVNNAALSTGGAISITPLGHIEIRSSSVNFTTNSASSKGGAVYILGGSDNHVMCGRISFVQNRAESGGAVFISSTNANASILGNILFEGNTATRLGGAVRISAGSHFLSGNVLLTQNTATENGGAIYIAVGNFSISGNVSFTHNSVTRSYGGAVAIDNNGVLNVTCNVSYFINNTANIYGGAIYNARSTAIIGGNISFINNSARLYGGAIAVFASGNDGVLILTGVLNFVANSVVVGSGGAVALFESPALSLVSPLQANFIRNSAIQNGGAISFDRLFTLPRCFSQSITSIFVSCPILLSSRSDIELGFINNSAGSAGTALYGGEFDTCSISVGGVRDICGNVIGGTRIAESATIDYIRSISSIVSNDSVTSDIASYPTMVCSCKTGQIVCPLSFDYNNIKLVRGQELTLQVATVGQGRGAVPSAVRINLQNNVQIAPSQRIQTTSKGCTSISYRLSGKMNTTMIKLAPDNSVCPSASIEVSVPITFLPCPDGFALRGPECTCEERLEQLNATCNVDDSSIERSSSNTFWIGALYVNGTYEGLITHSRCPFDYCVDTPVNFTLDNVDAQCQHNHSGALCGSCKSNLSTALGTLHCLPCSHSYLALILPFTLAGAALVAILLLLNLSVASGTLNGLIFYANIVQANHSDFFPPGETNILTVFIAWLNLDLGIETCFYDGMTTYAYTWLQFLFPFYVWFLIGLIIVACRYSIKISKSLGTNPVAVLATLFLLSYSKLLRNIIAVLSLTNLELPAGATTAVWLYDGNVPYFQRADHIVLGIFSILVLVFLFLPFTLLLLFGQLLHKYSNWKVFSWINKLKPFLDAYHAPYKKETRYWTGLLLLVRCILFLQFAFNTSNNNSDINLIFIISFLAGLAVLSWTHSGIYDKWYNNIIEASLILNLIILASATGHVMESENTDSQAAIAYTFVGIAFVTFISVLLYHVIISLRSTSTRRKLSKYVVTLTNRQNKGDKVDENERGRHDQENIELNAVINPILLPHSTFTELRETLLASEKT